MRKTPSAHTRTAAPSRRARAACTRSRCYSPRRRPVARGRKGRLCCERVATGSCCRPSLQHAYVASHSRTAAHSALLRGRSLPRASSASGGRAPAYAKYCTPSYSQSIAAPSGGRARAPGRARAAAASARAAPPRSAAPPHHRAARADHESPPSTVAMPPPSPRHHRSLRRRCHSRSHRTRCRHCRRHRPSVIPARLDAGLPPHASQPPLASPPPGGARG